MTVVIAAVVIVIVAIVGAAVREVFAAEPMHACRTCGELIHVDYEYCVLCLNNQIRADVLTYVQRRQHDPQLYDRIVDRLMEEQPKSEKAGARGSAPALAPTPKDLRSR